MDRLAVKAPAKINLGLHILSRRDDGYHEIETGMAAVGWYDELTFELSDALVFTCSDSSLPVDDSNLVVRAVKMMAGEFGRDPSVRVHLHKSIPYGAGLGGGSSDAAATLNALCKLWERDLPKERLLEMAALLGSDVPFFIDADPALASGRGEILSPLSLSLNHHVVILAGPQGISTAEAYGGCEPTNEGRPDLRMLLESRSPNEWRGHLENDFTDVAFRKVPELVDQSRYLEQSGADYVSLSGSGSAIYGLFGSEELARLASDGAPFSDVRTWYGRMV